MSLQGTVLMALLQPAPETFELFDDVLLLSEGYVVGISCAFRFAMASLVRWI